MIKESSNNKEVLFYCSFFTTKKVCCISSDGISITIGYREVFSLDECSYGFSSLFISQRKYGVVRATPKSFFPLLLIIAGAVKACPGPLKPIELANILCAKGDYMFHQSIRGLLSKKELIKEFLQHNKNTKIFTHSETHVDKSDMELIYGIPGYTFINSS